MNEIKQIEEIILVVKEKMTDNASIDIDEDLVSFNGNDFDHIAEQTAEALYNAGYRKIPEDAVVLSIEEIEEFRKDQAEVKFLKNKIVEQVRKETAREIWNRAKHDFIGLDEISLKVLKSIIKNDIGVEIKE